MATPTSAGGGPRCLVHVGTPCLAACTFEIQNALPTRRVSYKGRGGCFSFRPLGSLLAFPSPHPPRALRVEPLRRGAGKQGARLGFRGCARPPGLRFTEVRAPLLPRRRAEPLEETLTRLNPRSRIPVPGGLVGQVCKLLHAARSPGVRRKLGTPPRPADAERREAAAAVDVAEERGGGAAEVEPRYWWYDPRRRGLRDAARQRGRLLRHARHAADERGRGRRRRRARHAAVDRGLLVAAAEAAASPGLALRAGQAGAGNSHDRRGSIGYLSATTSYGLRLPYPAISSDRHLATDAATTKWFRHFSSTSLHWSVLDLDN